MRNQGLQTEIDASFLYERLAENETDQVVASVFREMSNIERSHAEAFAEKQNLGKHKLPKPSWRAREVHCRWPDSIGRCHRTRDGFQFPGLLHIQSDTVLARRTL